MVIEAGTDPIWDSEEDNATVSGFPSFTGFPRESTAMTITVPVNFSFGGS